MLCPPVTWWALKPYRVCLYSPTAAALLECAKQVGKLQLHALIFSLLVRTRRREEEEKEGGRGQGGGALRRWCLLACLPACLLLNGIQELLGTTQGAEGGGVRALKDG